MLVLQVTKAGIPVLEELRPELKASVPQMCI